MGNHVVETCPSIALLLTPSVQPVIQAVQDLEPECNNSGVVPINSVIMVVADKNLIEPSDDVFRFHCSHTSDFFMYFLAFLRKLLAACHPPHFETSSPGFTTDMCESQKIKRLRLLFASLKGTWYHVRIFP